MRLSPAAPDPDEAARLRAIFQSSTDFAIVATDLHGDVTEWGPGAERILGWSAAEMRGGSAERVFTPEDRAGGRIEFEMQAAAEHGRIANERWHLRNDGSRFWASGEMMALRSEGGEHIGYLKILRDRTAEHRAGQALVQSEASLRRAQEAGGLGVFTFDVATGLVHPTEQFCRLFGLDPVATISADGLAEFVVLDDAGHLLHPDATQDPAEPQRVEFRIQRADTNELRWLERRGEFERDADGAPVRFVGVLRDITRQHAAQTALIAREERYRALFDALDDGFCILEVVFDGEDRCTDYRFIEVNRAFERNTGLAAATGCFMRDLVPEHEQRWFDLYGEVARSGQPARFEEHAAALGRYYDVNAARIGGNGSNLVAVLFADVTERRMMENQLRLLNTSLEQQVKERTAEFERVWSSTTDLMGTAGLDGFLKSVNPAWSRLLGWSRAELLSRPFLDIVDPADHRAMREMVARISAGERVSGSVDTVLQKDGGTRIITWQANPDGAVFHIVGRDITEQSRAEEQLRQSQKMEAVGQLTGGLAHDFNNLLTGISGSLELLGNRVAQGRTQGLDRYIDAAQVSARRAAALTHRLLAFSRRQTLDPRPTDVDELIGGMAELMGRTVGPSIQFEVRRTPGLWPTLVDPNQLENALLNLAINARDAMPDGGRLVIATANYGIGPGEADAELGPGDYVSLIVADTGAGMPPEVLARAFEPFFTTKPLGQGTGLGLSMIYGFARQSGGGVRILSQPGQGTTVIINLPRSAAEPAAAAEPGTSPPVQPGAEPAATILVVDDEPTVRMLVSEVLDELGYRRLEAHDGASGLAILQGTARIDLLITDVGLPGGMNGRQMADAARIGRPGLKVLFITGFADNAVGGAELEPGMRVLTKPFPIDALTDRIQGLLAG